MEEYFGEDGEEEEEEEEKSMLGDTDREQDLELDPKVDGEEDLE